VGSRRLLEIHRMGGSAEYREYSYGSWPSCQEPWVQCSAVSGRAGLDHPEGMSGTLKVASFQLMLRGDGLEALPCCFPWTSRQTPFPACLRKRQEPTTLSGHFVYF
jgi:hypothetical protein